MTPTNDDGENEMGRSTGGLLEGVRVVEAASYVSGPFAAQLMADLGAEVIKVEPPAGDPMRTFGLRHQGLSALWVNVNRGKKSAVLDLKDAADMGRFRDLLRTTDVFVQNWRPGVAESLSLGDDALVALNPRMVRVAITGFGPTGPARSRPVFDILLQAESGLARSEGGAGPPIPVRSLIADKTTALFAANACLAALIRSQHTGRGSRIELAMLDVLAYYDFPDLGQDRTFLDPEAHLDLQRGRNGLLQTSDGYVAVSPVSGQQIGAAVTAVGHPEWKDDLKEIRNPTQLTDVLYDRLESVTRHDTTAHWLELFERHDVPAAAVMTMDEHFADDQVVNNELYSETTSPAGRVRQVRHPARVDGALLVPPGPAPRLDEHQAGIPAGLPLVPRSTAMARSLDDRADRGSQLT